MSNAVFRAKKLDLGGFINIRIIRDHTKRKVFEQHEPERYLPTLPFPSLTRPIGKTPAAHPISSFNPPEFHYSNPY